MQSSCACSSSRTFCARCLHACSECLPGGAAAQHASGQDRCSRACRGTVDQVLAARCGGATGCCGITGRRLTAWPPRRSADFDAQVFFHASEVQPADADAAAPAAGAAPPPGGAEALQALQQGDEVAFTAYPPPAPGAKWAARQARHWRRPTCAHRTAFGLHCARHCVAAHQSRLCSSTVHHALHLPSVDRSARGLCQRGRARARRCPSPPGPPTPMRDSSARRRAGRGGAGDEAAQGHAGGCGRAAGGRAHARRRAARAARRQLHERAVGREGARRPAPKNVGTRRRWPTACRADGARGEHACSACSTHLRAFAWRRHPVRGRADKHVPSCST